MKPARAGFHECAARAVAALRLASLLSVLSFATIGCGLDALSMLDAVLPTVTEFPISRVEWRQVEVVNRVDEVKLVLSGRAFVRSPLTGREQLLTDERSIHVAICRRPGTKLSPYSIPPDSVAARTSATFNWDRFDGRVGPLGGFRAEFSPRAIERAIGWPLDFCVALISADDADKARPLSASINSLTIPGQPKLDPLMRAINTLPRVRGQRDPLKCLRVANRIRKLGKPAALALFRRYLELAPVEGFLPDYRQPEDPSRIDTVNRSRVCSVIPLVFDLPEGVKWGDAVRYDWIGGVPFAFEHSSFFTSSGSAPLWTFAGVLDMAERFGEIRTQDIFPDPELLKVVNAAPAAELAERISGLKDAGAEETAKIRKEGKYHDERRYPYEALTARDVLKDLRDQTALMYAELIPARKFSGDPNDRRWDEFVKRVAAMQPRWDSKTESFVATRPAVAAITP